MACVQLFDHIASCIAEFLDELSLKHEHFTLGFTFSFPCVQRHLASATLVKWTKGFKCSGVEGEDVVALLHEAISRRQVRRSSLTTYLLHSWTVWSLSTIPEWANLAPYSVLKLIRCRSQSGTPCNKVCHSDSYIWWASGQNMVQDLLILGLQPCLYFALFPRYYQYFPKLKEILWPRTHHFRW